MFVKPSMFVPGKPFQTEPEPTRVNPLSGAPLCGRLRVLPINIRLGWKVLTPVSVQHS